MSRMNRSESINFTPSARSRLIVALDFPSADAASRMAEKLRGHVGMFKVGFELFSAEGPVLPRYLVARGEGVFLDLKFHDIPNTVRAAAREAASGGKRPLVLAVTVLTSLAGEDLRVIGLEGSPEEIVVRLAKLAQTAGLDGVVASAREARAIRRACGPDFVIVTPGIRPASSQAQDQVRVSTPADAIGAGADYLVVGRPITGAHDPAAAADIIVAEMEQAFRQPLIQ